MFGLPTAQRIARGHRLADTLSVDLDGINNYVNIGQPADLDKNPASSEITISAWVKPGRLNVPQYFIAKAKMETVNLSYILATRDDAKFYFLCGAGDSTVTSGTILVDTWYHVVFTVRNISGTYTAFLYVDQVEQGSVTAGSASWNQDVDWMMGACRWDQNAGDAYPFQGRLSDVTFWNVGMTASQVAELSVGGKPADPTTHSLSAQLLHWYRMGDGDTYPTITDRKGSANGTCTNMAGAGNIVTYAP